MSNPIMEVTVTGVLLRKAGGRELPLSQDEYQAIFDKVSDCLHGQVSDAGVSGQAETGELSIWFLITDADSFDAALKKMTTTISKVFRAADIVAEPVRKRTPLSLPRSREMTVISRCKMVNELLAA